MLIVFQAAKAAHLDNAHLSSWIWAISIGSGITGILLSLRFRAPVITAWSTPGAALLVVGLGSYPMPEAAGAFLFSAALITLFGVTGLFSAIMERIPQAIVAAMLAGILFRFGINVFAALDQLPALVLPMVICYLFAKRSVPRYAIICTLLVGFAIAFGLERINLGEVQAVIAQPLPVMPEFSISPSW